MKNLTYQILLVFVLGAAVSCRDFVEVGPPRNETASTLVYADDATAQSAVRGIYHEMVRTGFASGQSASITIFGGASADEFISYSPIVDEFFTNSVQPASANNSLMWSTGFKAIYQCNAVIEGLRSSTGVSSTVKAQLIAEAQFLRAFSHFYMASLYGDIPLITATDFTANAQASRVPFGQVLDWLISELTAAQKDLPQDFQLTSGERVRATSWAAKSLLARVYLYKGDWTASEQQSTAVINSPLFKIATDLNTVFLKNSTESIWQLMPIVPSQNTNEGIAFVPGTPTSLPLFVSMSSSLVSAFETGDKRKTNWVGSQVVGGSTIYYPFKYKISKSGSAVTEYSSVLRLAEQYFIRSEARARQGNYIGAMNDLDALRGRAGLGPVQLKINPVTLDNVLVAVEQERRIELFSEWGHRWLDLKRTGRAHTLLLNKQGWAATDVLYPVPQTELTNDPNLAPQNPGY